MGRTVTYSIPIAPIPWQRARLNGKHFFDNQQREKVCCGIYLQQQHGDQPPFSVPIHIEIIFYMRIPQEKHKRTDCLYHARMPDIDNLCKFILDCAVQSSILRDDRYVASISAKKIYDKEPRTFLTITEIE